MNTVFVSITVNGQKREAEVEARTLLVQLLRENLSLTGTHIGCETSQCGACTVLVNGVGTKSCSILAAQVDGQEVTTIEGLAPRGMLHPIQQAFWDEHGLQCGYCTPGMILTTASLLARNTDPTEEEIRHELHGNLCRCTGYQTIVSAIQKSAQLVSQGATSVPVDQA
ncbi:(2Fe-2S)-binding protein [soil metagenome]